MAWDVSVVIPNYNGQHLLERFLPSVIVALDKYASQTGSENQILVVDDASTDNSVRWLEANYPRSRVQVIKRPTNAGFSSTCNSGFKLAKNPTLVLLNNDVEAEENFLLPLIEHFQDPDVFAVTCKALGLDKKTFCNGGKIGRFRHGFWSAYANYDVTEAADGPLGPRREWLSMAAIGGFSAFDKTKLERLGGFDELFSPFYWEDIDLSYRAWKRGWVIRYEPRSVVYHDASSTINRYYQRSYVDVVSRRNRLIFHWKNLHDPAMRLQHVLMVLCLTFLSLLKLDVNFYRALYQAAKRLPEIRKAVRVEKKESVRTDREVRSILEDFYRHRLAHRAR